MTAYGEGASWEDTALSNNLNISAVQFSRARRPHEWQKDNIMAEHLMVDREQFDDSVNRELRTQINGVATSAFPAANPHHLFPVGIRTNVRSQEINLPSHDDDDDEDDW